MWTLFRTVYYPSHTCNLHTPMCNVQSSNSTFPPPANVSLLSEGNVYKLVRKVEIIAVNWIKGSLFIMARSSEYHHDAPKRFPEVSLGSMPLPNNTGEITLHTKCFVRSSVNLVKARVVPKVLTSVGHGGQAKCRSLFARQAIRGAL